MPVLSPWFGPSFEVARALWGAPEPTPTFWSAAIVAVEAPAPEVEPEPEVEPAAKADEDAHGHGTFRAPSEDDIEDDVVVGPPARIEGCEEWLEETGISYEASRLPVHEKGSITCGAHQAVRYVRGPGELRWNGKPKVTCNVALALGRFETVVQEEAERHLGKRVKKIRHMGTYNCREMAAYPGWVSEHAYANAIDIKSITLRGGKELTVLGNYGEPGDPQTPAERFFQAVARRTYDEDIFSTVLTPAFDRLHRNHFHLDMARYRVDGTVPD